MLLYSLLKSIYVGIINLRRIYEILILLLTPNRVYGLHLKGVGCNTPERLLLRPMGVLFLNMRTKTPKCVAVTPFFLTVYTKKETPNI